MLGWSSLQFDGKIDPNGQFKGVVRIKQHNFFTTIHHLLKFCFQNPKNTRIPDIKKERGKNRDKPGVVSSIKSTSCTTPAVQKNTAKKMQTPRRKRAESKQRSMTLKHTGREIL